ncbi:archease [Halococcus agarilyticus]|uniref:archease n=1 Tax=Halococcus agarilyticus TaxID=1232219 RepID=UPI0006778836|nr:archease [Halococcus agarilyticus]
MSFELREHTADVAVAADGASLDAAFAAVADGLAAAMCEAIPRDGGEHFEVTAAAENREALLYEYLAELIYQRDVRSVLPVDNQTTIRHDDGAQGEDAWQLNASARGVPLETIDAREVKAVTYSEMAIERTADGWRAYVVFDV